MPNFPAHTSKSALLISLMPEQERRLTALFKRFGWDFISVETSADAIRASNESDCCVIIIDVDNVDFYGPKVIGTLRSLNSGTRIVATGECHFVEFKAQLYRAGMDDFVRRSNNFEVYLNLFESHLASPRILHSRGITSIPGNPPRFYGVQP